MSRFIHKDHNVSVLMYHIVCPAKYRRAVFSAEVDAKLKEVCAEIEKRYEIEFLEIGTNTDHVHFLVQSVPMYSPKKIVQIIKSITAREIFRTCPAVKKYLWGGEFWTGGYFIATVGAHGNEQMVKNYVQQQGRRGTCLSCLMNNLLRRSAQRPAWARCSRQSACFRPPQAQRQGLHPLLYLSPDAPLASGLGLWRNRDPKRNLDWMTPEENWEMVDAFGNVFNRLILCRGDIPHSGASGWSNRMESGRLYQTFFFKVKDSPVTDGVAITL